MKKSLILIVTAFFSAGAFAGEVGDSLNFSGHAPSFTKTIAAKSVSASSIRETGFCAAPARDYDTVAINGVMAAPGVTIEVRTAATDWAPLTVKRFENGRFWGKYVFPSASREALDFRISAEAANNLKVYDIEVFAKAATMRDHQFLTKSVTRADLSAPSLPGVTLITRDQWGAKPATQSYTPHTPVMITVHHTAAAQPMTKDEGIKEMQFLQDLHQNTDGWIDIGYHFIIDGAGDIFQGRPMTVVGAHTEGKNTGNIGISLMGYFHQPNNNQPTDAQLASLKNLLTALSSSQNIPASGLYAHRELNATDCPGDIMYPLFQAMRTAMQQSKTDASQTAPADNADSARSLKNLHSLGGLLP